jgi:hypothetical protein
MNNNGQNKIIFYYLQYIHIIALQYLKCQKFKILFKNLRAFNYWNYFIIN